MHMSIAGILALVSTQVTQFQGGADSAGALVIIALVGCAGFVWAFLKLKGVSEKLASLEQKHTQLEADHRSLTSQERKTAKQLQARKDELTTFKRDLAAQKKKNHTAQEEIKRIRAQAKDDISRLDAQLKSRPAYSDRAPDPAEPKAGTPVSTQVEPQPARSESPAALGEATERAAEAKPAHDDALAKTVRRLEGDLNEMRQALDAEREDAKKSRIELRQMRRRVEQYRRADIMTKGRVDVLNDKLRTVGRHYYEAVSELAVMKGEVKPLPKDVFGVEADPTATDTPADPEVPTGQEIQQNKQPEQQDRENQKHVDSAVMA